MTHINKKSQKVVSGMRPTGKIHLGNYHGALKQWLHLQHKYECFFFIADFHALTTDYEDPRKIKQYCEDLAVDWLAAGLNPKDCKIFIQSRVPEHAELHLLLSMMTPLSWLERVPTYKDQQEKLKNRDLSTYGFLGYPVLQSADVLLYRASLVPVGEDQVAHIELMREIARRFNHIYGRGADFHEVSDKIISGKLGKKNAKVFRNFMKQYQEQGNKEALLKGKAMLDELGHLTLTEQEHLKAFLDGTGKTILIEPEAILTKSAKICGIDGQKMSKSYNNTIGLGESTDSIWSKIKVMPTDPARIKRTDPGDPNKCPVWNLHDVYSNEETKNWVQLGCKSANIGCVDCKKCLADEIDAEQVPIRERVKDLENDKTLINNILDEGAHAARNEAKITINDIKESMGLL
ncbi:MAG: tryptophan--tRNA ligase [Francisellaceae bacterium]|jgi:tryptophanyl-tRNA synthetase|nr:tryptophan--tRNA ligase [Francisellaceae bacterium]MBT6206809.1 tryptophan--tRNA ligase [Francisellaceae bacterium]MBT6539705.1 tryptophan--tRNA ligase [Francisellaceae bacterium]